jgi:hypothetical protein
VASVEFFFSTKCAAQAEAGHHTLQQPISATLVSLLENSTIPLMLTLQAGVN